MLAARERAALRLAGTPWGRSCEIPGGKLVRRFPPRPGGWDPIERAVELGQISGFTSADVLRVAWTLTDLDGRPRPGRDDCAAALAYRTGDSR